MHSRILRSANFKLALLYAAVFSISALVLVTFIFLSVRDELMKQAQARVEGEIAQLLGDYRDDGIDELRHDIRERIETDPANRLYYSILTADGRVLFDRIESTRARGWHRRISLSGHELLIDGVPLNDGSTLLVAADLSIIHEIEEAIRGRLAVMLLFVIVVAAMGGWLLSRRFLSRVDRLSKTAEQIGAGQLSARIATSGSGDDFDQLASTINRMLGRIEQLVGEVKHVSTDIAHDLRTPLGHVRQKLERMQQHGGSPDAIGEVIAMLDATLETFAALLRIAEIESGSRRSGFAPVDLSAMLNELAELYQPVAEEAGMRIRTTIAPDVTIEGDKALLMQCFVNLIENAMHHSQASELTVSLAGRAVMIADNGQGVGGATQEQLLQPFYRADPSRSGPGSGLGLPLVHAIVRLHGAALKLDDNCPGLRISISFPAS